MSDSRLRTTYLAYLATLNDRRHGDLDRFVAPTLTYNGRPLSFQEYVDLLAGDVAAVPDLRYDLRDLVVEQDRVAARIAFRCTPVREFLGLAPTGRTVDFAEHVFYRFVDGRIAEVESLIDRDAVRRQLLA